MPIQFKRTVTCLICGLEFDLAMNDGVTPETAVLAWKPICAKCRMFKQYNTPPFDVVESNYHKEEFVK